MKANLCPMAIAILQVIADLLDDGNACCVSKWLRN